MNACTKWGWGLTVFFSRSSFSSPFPLEGYVLGGSDGGGTGGDLVTSDVGVFCVEGVIFCGDGEVVVLRSVRDRR